MDQNNLDSSDQKNDNNETVDNVQQIEQPEISNPEQVPAMSSDLDIKKPSKKRLSKKLIIIIASVIILLLAVGGYLFLKKDSNNNSPSNNQSQTTEQKVEEVKKEPEIDPALQKFITPTTGETWLTTHKKVADLGFIKGYEDVVDSGLAYYEVGARSGNIIYLVSVPGLGETNYLFEKNPSGGVRFISQPNSNFSYNEETIKSEKEMLSAKVVYDNETHYDSLSFPNKVTLKNGYSVRLGAYNTLGDRIDALQTRPKSKLIETYGGSKLELVENTYPDTALTSIFYNLTLPTRTIVGLEYQPLNTDMSSYRFTTGLSIIKDNLVAITKGCGNLTSSVSRADDVKDTDLKGIGVSGDGQKLYEAVNPDNPLVKKAFDEFKEFYSTDTDLYKKNLSKDEFIKNHSVIFFKDVDNQWLVYAREEFRPAYGCAKPVVYLYPKYAQNISVKVGANVKISDPLYDQKTGWQNVWADPSGLLSYKGQDYQSLFWEGPGHGSYPVINSGVVVPVSQALATIKVQLSQQGLNQQEINDFIDYWEPNLPDKPYVRLSWLTTDQMNQLAPLDITPRPTTIIRTFLDFSGLDQPINLPAQQFSKPQRNGFTVVEWGGLSLKKLY